MGVTTCNLYPRPICKELTMNEIVITRPVVKPKQNLCGLRFGRLVVLSTWRYEKGTKLLCLCRCSCGAIKPSVMSYLMVYDTMSCGCLLKKRENRRTNPVRRQRRLLYHVWRTMKRRCYEPTNKAFKYYGRRGITVCERWMDFSNFLEDMQPSYKSGLTIERINNDGSYCPENCRWATQEEQVNNTRQNRYLEFEGIRHTISQWSRIMGIQRLTLFARLQDNWSVERALTTPVRKMAHFSRS